MLALVPLAAVVAAVAAVAACGEGRQEEVPDVTPNQSITVTSSAFKEGQPIPAEYSCDGPGRIPALSWQGAPTDAPLALVVDDPDAPRGTFTHWVVLDLPSGTTELDGESLPAGATEAMNSGGRVGWYPPCPPSGTHRYRFTVHALSRATGVPDGAPLDRALGAIRGFAVASGTLEGTYSRSR